MVEPNTVVEGSPAKYLMNTNELINKHKDFMKNSKIYDSSRLIQNGITNEMKKEMSDELENKNAYVI